MEQGESSNQQVADQPIGLSFQPTQGWWIATDDKWYPPELHPDYQPAKGAGAIVVASTRSDESSSTSDGMTTVASLPIDPAFAGEPAQAASSAPSVSEVPQPTQSMVRAEAYIPPASADSEPRHGADAQTTPATGPMANSQPAAVRVARKVVLTTWEHAWYIVLCVLAGIGYFAKIPAKKAMEDFRFCRMTSAEHFWYVVMCIPFGAAYLAKIPTAKALSELPQFRPPTERTLKVEGHE
jgi:hypothetical protein